MISFKHKGDFSKLTRYLIDVEKIVNGMSFDQYGQEGVKALASATPVDTGLTADSWYYEIERGKNRTSIVFYNSNSNKGVRIAIILQYGHGTRNGGWVEGRDYINPAIQPIFDKIAENAWREVTKL